MLKRRGINAIIMSEVQKGNISAHTSMKLTFNEQFRDRQYKSAHTENNETQKEMERTFPNQETRILNMHAVHNTQRITRRA